MSTISPLDPNPLAYINNQDLHSFNFRSLADLLSVPQLRHLVALRRWETFLKSGAQLQVHGETDEGVFRETVDHNIQGIKNSILHLASLSRSEMVLRPVMCLDHIYSYQRQSVFPELSMLLIGSRTEFEVLSALAYGVLPSQLKAIDLISYSPWITPGDMHQLPYPDNSFDVIVMGWVLNYSNTPVKVANEVIRVAKSGAVVSIGNDCNTREHNQASTFGYQEKPQSMNSLLHCFGDAVGNVYFSQEPNYSRGDIPGFIGHLIGTFEILK